jgi:hypothetical protein
MEGSSVNNKSIEGSSVNSKSAGGSWVIIKTANYWITPKTFEITELPPPLLIFTGLPHHFYYLLDYPNTFTIYWTTPNVIKAIATTPATDRELCFGFSRNRQSYITSSLDCIVDLGVDAAYEASCWRIGLG